MNEQVIRKIVDDMTCFSDPAGNAPCPISTENGMRCWKCLLVRALELATAEPEQTCGSCKRPTEVNCPGCARAMCGACDIGMAFPQCRKCSKAEPERGAVSGTCKGCQFHQGADIICKSGVARYRSITPRMHKALDPETFGCTLWEEKE